MRVDTHETDIKKRETNGSAPKAASQESRQARQGQSSLNFSQADRSGKNEPNVLPVRDLGAIQRPSRVVIDRLRPEVDGGRYPAKRFIDQPIEISAIILVDGHDHLKGRLLYRHETEGAYRSVNLSARVNDEWVARFQPDKLGRYLVSVEAAIDRFDTWKSDILKKLTAGQDVSVDLISGVQLLESWRSELEDAERRFLDRTLKALRTLHESASELEPTQLAAVLNDPVLISLAESMYDERSVVRYGHEVPIQVEPVLSRFSAWYEFFPRSASPQAGRHGTLKDAADRLDYVRKMGFDVVYFPPLHPIGRAFRKGKNNALITEEGDVGSPWAIGGVEGGHKSLHPSLGSWRDFDELLRKAKALELEIAMDIAFQCSPDHPYVKEHPEWFKKRADGTIQYAENPPKKYQDIYPFDFETPEWRSLWRELRDVVQFWVDRGIRVFRIDNPHTKPFHFWEWLIREIRSERPDVIFLAEAFTRPEVMAYLAKAGFSQSYTYFAWRNTKWELTQYLSELTKTELIDYFGANFWPNTPDILPEPLQSPHRGVYVQRLILAATLSSNYGLYGPTFELMDHEPRQPGSEEYLDSEKYQLRTWDLDRADSLAPLIERVNQIRRDHKSLQNNRSLRFHPVSNDSLIAYSKSDGASGPDEERVLVVVNLDPHHVQSGLVELPLLDWGIDPSETFQVHDLLTDARYYWTGWRNYVELNPHTLPAHVFVVRRRSRSVTDFEYFV